MNVWSQCGNYGDARWPRGALNKQVAHDGIGDEP